MRPAPQYGRDSWPRTRRLDIHADFDFDRPCGNCGYNLRGLPLSSKCPECGAVGGITTTPEENIPWDDDSNPVSFIGTILMVILRPRGFARLAWSPVRFEMPKARAFRRWNLILAVIGLCWAAFEITRTTVGFAAAMFALPFDLAAVIVYVNSVSLEPIAFIKATASPVARRAEVVAHYTSAPLALSLLQPLMLFFSLQITLKGAEDIRWLIAAGMHLVLLFGQLLLSVNAASWMFYELVEVSRTRALGYTLMRSMASVGAALPMLIGIPALAAVASKALAG